MRLLREGSCCSRLTIKRAEFRADGKTRSAPQSSVPLRNASATGTANYPALRIHAVNHPGKGDDFPDVFGSTNPRDGALQAEPKAGVRHAAVAAQVEIPLERFFGQVVLAQTL